MPSDELAKSVQTASLLLIGAATALLAGISAPAPMEARLAANEARAVTQFAAACNHHNALQQAGNNYAIANMSRLFRAQFVTVNEPVAIQVTCNSTLSQVINVTEHLGRSDDSWFTSMLYTDDRKASQDAEDALLGNIRTLADFKACWDHLHAISRLKYVRGNAGNTITSDSWKQCHAVIVSNLSSSRPAITEARLFQAQWGKWRLNAGTGASGDLVGKINYMDASKGIDSVTVPVELSIVPFDAQAALWRDCGIVADVPSGEFAKSFPHLDRMTTDVDSLSIDQLTKFLSKQVTEAEKTISIAGVELPRLQLSLVGAIVVICVQWYLLANVNELRQSDWKSNAASWFALHQNWNSRSISLTALVVLPVAAIASAAWIRLRIGGLSRFGVVLTILCCCVEALIAGWSTVVLFSFWHSPRPHAPVVQAEPAAPASALCEPPAID